MKVIYHIFYVGIYMALKNSSTQTRNPWTGMGDTATTFTDVSKKDHFSLAQRCHVMSAKHTLPLTELEIYRFLF